MKEGQVGPRRMAALFDLDGTLVDTRPGVRAAVAAAFTEVTGDESAGERVDLSLSLDDMILSADAAAPPALRRLVSAAFRRHYDSDCWNVASLNPGAEECLSALRDAGVRLFVVTNKRTGAAERLLEHFHLAGYLEAIVGQTDGGEPLPKSQLVGRCLADAGLDPASTVVVGDSDQDAAAAASWGMLFIAVASGTGPLGHASAVEKRVEVDSLADVAAFALRAPRGEDREP